MNYKQVIQQLVNQLKQYVGDKKAIVGISGGVDSAVTTTLCVKALGKENVLGILMPYANQDMTDAVNLVSKLGIKSKEINIQEIVDKFDFAELDKVSKGNIMARVRMILLYAFANKLDGLVIGTGNKSEIEIGYFTKYGDGGVDVEPLGDIYKTEVYEIAKILEAPRKILNKKPSAELWEGQTDEDEFGITYEKLDSVLKGEIPHTEAPNKIQKMIKNSEHKRNAPPIFEVTKK